MKYHPLHIIWFNPPYSKDVKTNIGRTFLNLIDRHFPASNKLSKIFNRNTIKLSHSCMDNMRSIINKHNGCTLQKINSRNTNSEETSCNCQYEDCCPLQVHCLTVNLIYQAKVKTSDNATTKKYIGMSANPFKSHFNNHKIIPWHKVFKRDGSIKLHLNEINK